MPPNFTGSLKRMSYFNWKLLTVSFLAGATVAFSETVFENYFRFTYVESNSMLPVKIQFQIKSHPLYEKLSNCNTEKWSKVETDSQSTAVYSTTKHCLVGQFIGKPGGMMINPVLFFEPDLKKTISLVHLGYRMCGYPFLVHGGVIATLLNESSKASAFLFDTGSLNSMRNFKVHSLSVSYRYPTLANQVLAIETSVPESGDSSPSGTSIKSRILSEKGEVLVESEALLSPV